MFPNTQFRKSGPKLLIFAIFRTHATCNRYLIKLYTDWDKLCLIAHSRDLIKNTTAMGIKPIY